MTDSVYSQIELKVRRSKPGQIFMPADFKDLGTSAAIRKALSRLVEQNQLVRMGQGIYTTTIQDDVFGPVMPTVEEMASIIAKKERVKIMPSGQYALNKIGLSTQVPMRLVYLTSGNKKSIAIGKSALVFKPASAKKLAMIGPISSLLFLGLEELELDRLTDTEREKIGTLLQQEDPRKLRHDLRLVSARISDFVMKNFKVKVS